MSMEISMHEPDNNDRLALAQRLKTIFKHGTNVGGCWSSFMKLIEVPITFLRDYTTPMA